MQHQYPKFRAWHKELKEIFMVEHMQWKDGVVTHITRFRKFGNSRQDLPVNELKYIELMQWTGFVNFDNQDLYVGDIVDLGYDEKYQIIFDGTGCFAIADRDNKFCWHISMCKVSSVKVIGNIYENMELLNATNN